MGVEADRWLAKYQASFESYVLAASAAEGQILDAFRGLPLDLHAITARAKDPDSVAEKIARRSYGRPSRQFDDLIGIRVITLYEHSIPLVVARLRAKFEVDDSRSINKSDALKRREVGYRSVHLVLKVRKSGMPPVSTILETTWVEVQIRTVVSHAWAEIEHSLRYKAGIVLPNGLSRRFDALAGTLELVDREFSAIEDELVAMVRDLSGTVGEADLTQDITPISLLAVLPAYRPSMATLGPKKLVLPMEQAYQLAKVSRLAGITNLGELVSLIQDVRLARILRKYVDESSVPMEEEESSAIVVMGALVALKDRDIFDGFRAFQLDPVLVSACDA